MFDEPRPLLSRMGAFGVPALFQGSLTPRCERHLRAGKSKPIALTRQLPMTRFVQYSPDAFSSFLRTIGNVSST